LLSTPYGVGQNRTYGSTAYPDTPYNRIRKWKFPTVSVSVWPYIGFGLPYIYAVCTVVTVYTPYMDRTCRWCRIRIPATAVLFAPFGHIIFSCLFLPSSFFPSLFYKCMFFALINSFIGGYGSWTPFCTGKGFFWVFLAWSRPNSLTIHYLGIKDWIMRIQLFKSCKMTPYELILSEFIFPRIR
jgi:hypothetical protein